MSGYERIGLAAELVSKGIEVSDASAIATHTEVNSVDDAYDMLGELKALDAMGMIA